MTKMPSNTYQWVAGVARAEPTAVFWRAKRRRDGKTRIGVTCRRNGQDIEVEFAVEDTSAMFAVFEIRRRLAALADGITP